MLRVGVGPQPQYSFRRTVALPDGFDWDEGRFGFVVSQSGRAFRAEVAPKDLVDSTIWTGPAFHVDGASGDDVNSGLGAFDGDFADAKRSIYAAFLAGNATGAAYRVLVKPGRYQESAFTRNGNDEPDQPVAIIGWGGKVHYRTGPFSVSWNDMSGTWSTAVSAVRRVFRTDVLTPEGQYTELRQVADVTTCAATPQSWALDGSMVHVNIEGAPSPEDIALIRSFHGARFMSHDSDIYLENIEAEGGITGSLHFDAVAQRNIVAVGCSFRYSAPSNPAAPLDAVRVRRTNGLAAFFDCDASQGAKDGWSFHEDGTAGLHVLLQDCTSWRNGIEGASSCNAFTTHDGTHAIVLNGGFGLSRNGTEVHTIQTARTWLAGTTTITRDIDGSSTAYKCSNQSRMWLQGCTADAAGTAINYAVEANSGEVFTRDLVIVSGGIETVSGGTVTSF